MLKIKNKNLNVLTNTVLVVAFTIVFSVSLIGGKSEDVYGKGENAPLYLGNAENKNVSIMINCYENADVVNKMIDLFLEKKVNATFFVGGCWADDNREILNKMVQNGFEIGNHGYFHKDHKKISYENNKQEIENCDIMVKNLCGYKMNLFAPPSGSYSVETLSVAKSLNYKVIMWSKDTIDWRDSNTDVIFKRATNNLKNGDLILMHPKAHSLSVLPSIIDFYLKNGFNIVSVGENIEGL